MSLGVAQHPSKNFVLTEKDIHKLSIDQIESTLLSFQPQKFDMDVDVHDSAFEVVGGKPTLKTPQGDLLLTNHSGAQMATRADIPRGTYEWLLEHETDKLHEIMGKHWKLYTESQGASKKMLVRGWNPIDGSQATCRAVLSDRYAIVDNLEIIQAMKMIFPTMMGEISFCGMGQSMSIGPDSMRLKLILPASFDDQQDKHIWGWTHRNSEIGAGSWATFLGLLRMQCTNQIQLGDENMINMRHVGFTEGLSRILEPLTGAVSRALSKNSDETFRSYYNLRDRKLENPAETLRLLEKRLKLGQRLVGRIVDEKLAKNVEELGENAYAVVQSITEFARDMEDREKALYLEESAGKICALQPKDWKRIN